MKTVPKESPYCWVYSTSCTWFRVLKFIIQGPLSSHCLKQTQQTHNEQKEYARHRIWGHVQCQRGRPVTGAEDDDYGTLYMHASICDAWLQATWYPGAWMFIWEHNFPVVIIIVTVWRKKKACWGFIMCPSKGKLIISMFPEKFPNTQIYAPAQDLWFPSPLNLCDNSVSSKRTPRKATCGRSGYS